MNSLTTYWLSRTPGASPEGPFTLGQLRAMYGTGAINAEAQVCPNGEQEWTEARWMLEDVETTASLPASVPDNSAAMAARMRRFEEELTREKKGGTSVTTWGCLIFVILFVVFGIIIPKGDSDSAPSSSRPVSAIDPSRWDGAVPEVKSFIERSVRDPSTVKYNQWKNFTTSTNHITTVDFTATNGLGGPSRETWTFSFDKHSGQLQTVFDGKTFLFDAVGAEVK